MPVPIFKSAAYFKRVMNLWPVYWGTGISIRDASDDFMTITVQMKQRFYNGNAFGTHFGGSLYSMCDPFFVLQLVPLLGPDYIIWDRSASIDFIKPGKGTVTARFAWTPEQLADIQQHTDNGEKYQPSRTVEVVDEEGEVIARVQKTLYIRRKPSRRPSSEAA